MQQQGGGYLIDLLDYYAAGWPYLFIGFTELIVISYVYGIQNFLDDLYHIFKFNPGLNAKTHFMVLYKTVSPLIIFFILIISWARYEPLTKGDYTYPGWANAIGWIIAMTAILAVPAVAIFQLAQKTLVENKDEGSLLASLKKSWFSLLEHTPEWRANANRARKRDGEAEGTGANGKANYGAAAANGGFDNLAMENEEGEEEVTKSRL